MRIGIADIDWKQVGAMLAQEDDDGQVDFFKSFVKECGTWGAKYQIETQLASVNQKLTTEEKQVLSMLGFEEQ